MPPCFSAASAALETASTDNTAAATTRTLRMLSSLDISASYRAAYVKRYPWRGIRATSKHRRQYWYFGLTRPGAAASPGKPRRCDRRAQPRCPEPSNLQLVAALQIENFTGLVGGRDF